MHTIRFRVQFFLIIFILLSTFNCDNVIANRYLILSANSFAYEDVIAEEARYNSVLLLPQNCLTNEECEAKRASFGEVHFIKDYAESGKVESLAYTLHIQNPFDRIIAIDEFDLLRAAKLRSFLGITGQSFESAKVFRDKLIMKTAFMDSGIGTASFLKVDCATDLIEASLRLSYPLVLKPRRSAGSEGVRVISTHDDLHGILESSSEFTELQHSLLIAEKFVEGEMYHISGLVEGGKIIVCWPSKYYGSNLNFKEGKAVGSYLLSSDSILTPDLIEFAQSVMEKLPTPSDTAFYLEVFANESGFQVCEVASRVGGDVSITWEQAFGISLTHEFIRLQTGIGLSDEARVLPASPKTLCGELYFPRTTGTVQRLPVLCPYDFVKDFTLLASLGEEITASSCLFDRLAVFRMILAPTEEEILERFQNLLAWYQAEILIE